MSIRSSDIDGFGVWHALALGALSEHATVIYGANEAGKTAVMQFVRAVLYGFTPERRKRYLPPVNGGQPGGRLRVHNEFGSFTIERRPEIGDLADSLQIIDDRGEAREVSQLETLLAGVDEPT